MYGSASGLSISSVVNCSPKSPMQSKLLGYSCKSSCFEFTGLCMLLWESCLLMLQFNSMTLSFSQVGSPIRGGPGVSTT